MKTNRRMSKIKMSVVLLMICSCMMMLAGCGGSDETNGEWVWTKTVHVDENGQKVETLPGDIGMEETYIIKGNKIHNTYRSKDMTEPTESDMKLKKVSEHTYNFVLAGNVLVENAEFIGDTFTYTTGNGAYETVFERKPKAE